MVIGNNINISKTEISSESYDFDKYLYPENYSYYSTCEIEDYIEYKESYVSDDYLSVEPTILLDGPMDSPWPMYCHDVRHTGRSPYSTADNPYEIKWIFDIYGPVWGGPVIDEDGIIYIGTDSVYALYPNGKLKWRYEDSFRISSTPAIDENGVLYIGAFWTGPQYMYAINKDNGNLKWRFHVGEWIASSPVIGEDGSIYFGSENDYIYALYPNGTLKWKYKTSVAVYSSPAIGSDGTVYCGSHDTYLYAFYPNNGTVKWKYKTGNWIRTAPCIDDDGTIYVVSLDNYLYAVFPNGALRWKTNVGAGTSPTIGQDGTIYCGYDELHAVNPSDGTIKWKLPIGGQIRGATPCNSIDGTIYLGNGNGSDIVAVNPDGTEKWRKSIGGDIESAPAIGEDGTIYIGDGKDEGHIYAFGLLDSNAPSAPDINGPRLCLPGIDYKYKFTSTSPVGNRVYYLVEWGDGTVTGWSGTYESGETVTFYHKWATSGSFTIKARAKDTNNLWGPWSEHEITIPRSRTSSYLWYQWFLERFPILERLLNLFRYS
jgi:outer membrane protein assembly factor BamB